MRAWPSTLMEEPHLVVTAESRTTKGKGRLWGHSQHLVFSSLSDAEPPSRSQTGLYWNQRV